MKKIIAILLAVLMIWGTSTVAFAREYVTDQYTYPVPIVNLGGDGAVLHLESGETVNGGPASLLDVFGGEYSGEKLTNFLSLVMETTNQLIKGNFTGDYDDYYDALRDQMSYLYEPMLMDKNGDPINKSDIWDKNLPENCVALRDGKTSNFTYYDFTFAYDWRMDPFYTAAKLNDYIQLVKQSTGFDKVALSGRCLGAVIVIAYLALYGTDDICGLGFNGPIAYGSDVVTDVLTGEFKVDLNGVSRFLAGMNDNRDSDLDEALMSTLSLLENSGAVKDATVITKDILLKNIYEGALSSVVLSIFITCPSFWALVKPGKLDKALDVVFGKEGSRRRAEYSVMVDKIVKYHETVRANIDTILKDVEAKGINICVVSKYGFQMIPLIKKHDILADEQVSVADSSFGATTVADMYSVFDDDYLASADMKYISPDKQIDASTCLFPNYTWFLKGIGHSKWANAEHYLCSKVITADHQLTIDDTEAIFDVYDRYPTVSDKKPTSQFLVYDMDTSTELWDNRDGFVYDMTEENCKTGSWETTEAYKDYPENEKGGIKAIFESYFRWIKTMFSWIGKLLKTK